VWRSQTLAGVRCAHFPSVFTIIMDHKVQLLNPLNLRELYTTYQNPYVRDSLIENLGNLVHCFIFAATVYCRPRVNGALQFIPMSDTLSKKYPRRI
jgi:hypothetical protein